MVTTDFPSVGMAARSHAGAAQGSQSADPKPCSAICSFRTVLPARLSPVPAPTSLAAALGWTAMTMYAGVRHVSVGSQTHTTAV